MKQDKTAVVVGAGIVGLAAARALAIKGYTVTVFERNPQCIGASIRNFGMVWPVGQPNGELYQRAMRSRSIWKSIADEAGLWHDEVGSLHLAYKPLQATVMQELVEINKGERSFEWLNVAQVIAKSPAANPKGLLGALWSPDEMILESRKAIHQTALYLQEKYDIQFLFNTVINRIDHPTVWSGTNSWSADLIIVCSGADFETLYPQVFEETVFTKCKLQMMRLVAQPDNWRIGPSLCGGLSLIHYKGFASAPSLPQLKKYYESTMTDYLRWGIHVMVSQNGEGELTIGDSHEYGRHLEPFDKEFINRLILDYMKTFAQYKDWTLAQSWNGIYPKLLNGENHFYKQVENGVHIINGLGGNGMTLSLGLGEELVEKITG
jgi:FAD dependent oxidoreductase TIGR03364